MSLTKRMTVTALLGAFLLASAAMAPQGALAKSSSGEPAQQEAKPDYSKGFLKKAGPVQKLLEEKKWPEALDGVKELEALPDLTTDDRRVILSWKVAATQAVGDRETMFATLEEMLKDGMAKPEQVGPWQQNLAAWYSSKKDLPNTLLHYRAYIDATADPAPTDMVTLGRLYQQTGDDKHGIEWINKAIAADKAKGQQAPEVWYQLLDHSYVAVQDDVGRLANLEAMVEFYPKSGYYSRILGMFEKNDKDDRVLMMNSYRLVTADTGLETVGGYLGYATLALDVGSPGEAVRALEKGMASGVVPSAGSNEQLLKEAKATLARDKKELPKDAVTAARNPQGEVDAKVGLGFYSLGQWAKAVEAVKRGLGKGGVKRIDDANLLLGASLLELGKYDQAQQAFAAAGAAAQNDYMRQLASLWSAYATRKAGGGSPAAGGTAPANDTGAAGSTGAGQESGTDKGTGG